MTYKPMIYQITYLIYHYYDKMTFGKITVLKSKSNKIWKQYIIFFIFLVSQNINITANLRFITAQAQGNVNTATFNHG